MHIRTAGKINVYLEKNNPFLHRFIHRHQIGLRYVLAGCVAATVDLGLLYVLTEWLKLWYITSTNIAFVASFLTSFTLQKFWTFKDNSLTRIPKQLTIYIIAGVASLSLNSMLMYFFVDKLKIWYMAAQVLTAGILAMGSFILNHKVTFKKRISV